MPEPKISTHSSAELLEDREHHVLLAHGRRVLDVEFLGESQQIGGGFGLQILQFHGLQAFLHRHGRLHPE